MIACLKHQKTQQNDRDQGKIVMQAEQNRNFLLTFATAYLSPLATNLQGRWSFPSGEIELQLNGPELHGNREDRSQTNSPLRPLFGTPKTITKIERFNFSGSVSGRSCKFKIEITRTEEPSGWSFLGGPSDSKIEGYIVFAEDGKSGKAVEVKAGKPEKYYDVLKRAQCCSRKT